MASSDPVPAECYVPTGGNHPVDLPQQIFRTDIAEGSQPGSAVAASQGEVIA